ncbi:late expression factor 2 [Neodiprion abietis nucleopolyhedrovirus]|uniref:Late expression factor 2 n=1 Tax=Neodiprion abietis nucleopolyhedrovirus TaxID=204507 RepID=Q0ZP23_9CBAC|nr:late expression factor 2 [Neodiprion abietis nucleopolyhedrovirus]ABC74931.1 late expression factor 2 [Neodiprion abietis nucleopolyhedrovirus]
MDKCKYVKNLEEYQKAVDDDATCIWIHYTLYPGKLTPLHIMDQTRMFVYVDKIRQLPAFVSKVSPEKVENTDQWTECFDQQQGPPLEIIQKTFKLLPPCVSDALNMIDERPTSERFHRRFILHTYLKHKYSCKIHQNKSCLQNLLSKLYQFDKKCVLQMNKCFDANMKPYNCSKIILHNICPVEIKCHVNNPLSW